MGHANLLQTYLVGNKLTYQVHQGIQLFYIHTNRLSTYMGLLVVFVIGLCLGCCWLCCWLGWCRSRSSFSYWCDFLHWLWLRLLLFQHNLRSLYCRNFRNGGNSVLYLLCLRICYQAHIKAAVKFFLLQILGWRNRLDNISQLIQHIHNHVRTSGFQQTGLCNLYMDPIWNQTTVFGFLDNHQVSIIQLAALRCLSTNGCSWCRCS